MYIYKRKDEKIHNGLSQSVKCRRGPPVAPMIEFINHICTFIFTFFVLFILIYIYPCLDFGITMSNDEPALFGMICF